MSVEAWQAVWEHSKAKGGKLLLLLAIADFYETGKPEKGAWPALPTLAARARLSRRQTQKLLRQVEKDGELQSVDAGVLHRSKTYFLRLPIGGRTFDAPHVVGGVAEFTPGVSQSSPQGCRR